MLFTRDKGQRRRLVLQDRSDSRGRDQEEEVNVVFSTNGGNIDQVLQNVGFKKKGCATSELLEIII